MSDKLVIPAPSLVTASEAAEIEHRIARWIATVESLDEAEELRRRADALEAYLQGREGHPHAQGIARRIEARIGELLGPDRHTGGRGRKRPYADGIERQRRGEYRALAAKVRKGMLKYETDGDDSPWRSSRRGLLLGTGAFSAEATGRYEWYTPPPYIAAARRVMGGIDLDPASSAEANEVVQARRFFTEEQDGLAQRWSGRVWMNPPYSHPTVEHFCAKLCAEYLDGAVTQAITLTYAATETDWFHTLAEVGSALAFPRHRVPYWTTGDVEGSAPLKGSALVYLGPRVDSFRAEYEALGITAVL